MRRSRTRPQPDGAGRNRPARASILLTRINGMTPTGRRVNGVKGIRVPKIPPRKRADPDRAWQAGDSIPLPEAVHSDGESAWALWNEVAQQHEAKFAPTAPMTVPPPGPQLTPAEAAWAATQPAGKSAKLPPAPREAQPLFTLEGAMLVARKNNRVCPRPERWAEFHALLPPRKTLRGTQQPPAPVTGPAWAVTPPLTKRLCFREQIEWAERAGILEAVMAFMHAMAEEEWLHMHEEP